MEEEKQRYIVTKGDQSSYLKCEEINEKNELVERLRAKRSFRYIRIFDENEEEILHAKRVSWFFQKWLFFERKELVGNIKFRIYFSFTAMCSDDNPRRIFFKDSFFLMTIHPRNIISFQDESGNEVFYIKSAEDMLNDIHYFRRKNRYWTMFVNPSYNPAFALLITTIFNLRRNQVTRCTNC